MRESSSEGWRKGEVAMPERSNDFNEVRRQVIATFSVDPQAWSRGQILCTCSLCGSTSNAGPTNNAAVHNDMRMHLKVGHRMKGISSLRSEIIFGDLGAISAVEFYRC
jgi:hypothetical protein